MCFNESFVNVYYTEDGSQTKIGKIGDANDCCNEAFEIYDRDDRVFAKVFTHSCQCGIYCKGCCCEASETVLFKVHNKEGKTIATLTKKLNKGCMKSMSSDADSFGFDFPDYFDWEQRTLFMVTMVFIDYMMFEEHNRNNSDGTGDH